MLISVTEKVDIPDEPEQWMRFRALSYGQRQQAREIAQRRSMDDAKRATDIMKLLSGNDVDMERKVDEARAKRDQARAERVESVEPVEQDVLVKYDAATVVDYGIAEWSYPEKPSKPSDQLMPETLEWAARQIMERNTRPLSSALATGTS